jgi:hypothetical protein
MFSVGFGSASNSTHQTRSRLSGRPESAIEGENLIRALIERAANIAVKVEAMAAVLEDSLGQLA